MQTVFVSGHLDLTPTELEVHYVPHLRRAVARGDRFVVGDARGADAMASAWLAREGAPVTVFHMFDAPRNAPAGVATRGGYKNDDHRDSALTAASDTDIAWVRPGREGSGTAKNLKRRGIYGPLEARVATPDDWDRCRSLRLTALLDAPDAFGSTFAEESVRDDAFWHDRMARPEVTTLLATFGPRDAGLAVVAPVEAGVGGLYSMWVAALCRGRGVADALMDAAFAEATARGYRRLVLDVAVQNTHARGLYARHGFRETGRTGALPPPRDHIPEIEMERVLDA
ncbi:MAG: GNAT family N-acetyltransferase [Alphaproteobacteria bacterium]|nr:GNAT family N-acetyltransferase [Alphaproteobacteria bacterium]